MNINICSPPPPPVAQRFAFNLRRLSSIKHHTAPRFVCHGLSRTKPSLVCNRCDISGVGEDWLVMEKR